MMSPMMQKMMLAKGQVEEEKEGPEESSLSDLIAMLEDVIANKGRTKKGMDMSVSIMKPKGGMTGMDCEEETDDSKASDLIAMRGGDKDDEEEKMKKKFF